MGAKKIPSSTSPTASKNSTTTLTKKAPIKSKDNAVESKSGSNNLKKSDNSNKVTKTATSNKKICSKPVAINNDKIVLPTKKPSLPQILGDLKKNKSRDNSIDSSNKKQGVNSKSMVTVAEQAKSTINFHTVENTKKEEVNLNHEKCNKNEKSDNSMKKENDKNKSIASEKHGTNHSNSNSNKNEPKKVNNKKSADKPKSSKTINTIKKANKNKIKISNELKNLAIDGIQRELSSGLKTSICEMVKLKKARHNPNDNSSISTTSNKNNNSNNKNINKVKEPQDKSLLKKVINEQKESSLSKNLISSTLPTFEVRKEIKSLNQSIINDNNNGTNAKVIKKIITASNKSNNDVIVKRKYVKKILNDKDNKFLINNDVSKSEISKKSEGILLPPTQVSLQETKKLKTQNDAVTRIIGSCGVGGSKSNSTIIPTTNQKEKEKQQKKENASNQSSAKLKGNNEETKVSNAKYNESKVAVNAKKNDSNKTKMTVKVTKNKEQAISAKINVASVKKPKAKVATKSKVVEKDPLKISSSSSENENSSESENEKEFDSVFKKPPKPKAKQNVRGVKIVKKITTIKKCRVASLNAIAKVHCLYENEARVQHLDHSSGSITKVIKKPAVVSVCNVSSDDDADDDDEDEDEDEDKECVSKRSLRTAPGLRAVGKHWEMDSMSSEIDTDSDTNNIDDDDDNDDESKIFAKDDAKAKSLKMKNQQLKSKQQSQQDSKSKLKNQIKRNLKSLSNKQTRDASLCEGESDKNADKKAIQKAKKKSKAQIVSPTSKKSASIVKKSNGSIKRKKTKDDDKNYDRNLVTKKRMASLNASAILAANYEIENYAAKHESSSTETSDSSENEDDGKNERDKIEPPTMKKEKKDVKMETAEETRPKSTTNLVKIDTDVTITGVYVNTALVSSQETICKTLKYRTAYSVTEECVVSRPPTQEPPKSYTPLSALTNMRPPGGQIPDPCMTSSSDQYQPHMPQQYQHQQPQHSQMYDPHMMGPMPPYQYPPPPPTSHPHPMPSTSSAFYPPQQVHRDPMGYQLGYQPAGPLLSPHLLPPQPIPPPPLESDQTQSNQSTGASGENDPDVMITGGDLTPRPPYRYSHHPPPPLHHQQMHYPPTYPAYSYYGQPHPQAHQDLCYPYYQPKYFPPNSPYNRRPPYVPPGYYQPPLDYRPPPQPPVVPQNAAAPSQIVPAPTPTHIDPHYSTSPYYSSYASGQCYSQTPPRNLQPPTYLDPQAYHHHNPSCPCPMQSCQSKNVHTGTGPIKAAAKGSVSASSNGINENLPKTSISTSSATITSSSPTSTPTKVSCKVEIKPEHEKMKKLNHNSSNGNTKPHDNLYDYLPPSSMAYSMNLKVLDTAQPEHTPSPARGSTGLIQIPPAVQHEAVQPALENINNNSDNNNKKQVRKTHLITPLSIFQTSLAGNPELMQQFKQEYPEIKRERDTNSEKDFEEINLGFRIINPHKVKQEKFEMTENLQQQQQQPQMNKEVDQQQNKEADKSPPVPIMEKIIDQVNLINESGDESITTTSMASKRKADDSNDDVIELSDNSILEAPSSSSISTTRLSMVPALKRRKLLERPMCATPKKSPPNSYKSLIKQNSNYTSTYSANASSPVTMTAKSKLISTSSALNKSTIRRKSIFKSKAATAFKTMRFAAVKVKRRALKKKKKKITSKTKGINDVSNHENSSEKSSTTNDENVEPIDGDDEEESEKSIENDNTSVEEEEEQHHEEKSMDGSSEYSGKSNIDLTIDRVAKGYFSESEIFSSLNKHRKTKSQKKFEAKLLDLCEKKKKKKKEIQEEIEIKAKKNKKKVAVSQDVANSKKKADAIVSKIKDKKDKNEKKKKVKETKKSAVDDVKEEIPQESVVALQGKKATSKSSKKSKAKEPPIEIEVSSSSKKQPKKSTTTKKPPPPPPTPKKIEIETDDDAMTIETTVTKDEDTSTTLISSAPTTSVTTKPLLDETDVANNNDEYFEDNNHRHKHQEPLTLYKTPGYGWTTALNKTSNKRGKKAKYTKTKKLRVTIPSDIVIPKSTSIPRWSNGWTWEGAPYQALVFLNSDDPPVLRTCYDSMRHEECGDVIRPRDCVLLRAGGKRNELPYVAKVAQLWENPEDGEMMMSLFWYYRPEHTEQGRQSADAIDEVFASRHKDHNSVACIEDKCYVITYNEYCRYRKKLKSVEENYEETQPLVPRHYQSSDRRAVPPNTSPELVMFCRRVYDFRSKRLIEDKKKK